MVACLSSFDSLATVLCLCLWFAILGFLDWLVVFLILGWVLWVCVLNFSGLRLPLSVWVDLGDLFFGVGLCSLVVALFWLFWVGYLYLSLLLNYFGLVTLIVFWCYSLLCCGLLYMSWI